MVSQRGSCETNTVVIVVVVIVVVVVPLPSINLSIYLESTMETSWASQEASFELQKVTARDPDKI